VNARAIWQAIEPIHAVTYFADECEDAFRTAGLKGFWMGYFAGRSAPMGEVGPEIVEATFFNFHPSMVQRALPDAWTYATAASVLDVRANTSAAVLRQLVDGIDDHAATLLPLMQRAIDAANAEGRPLFAANRDVTAPDDPVAALWQATTALREHRGDGHVAALTAAGLDGCETHVLFAMAHGVSRDLYLRSRGWSDDDWSAAEQRLRSRGAGPDLLAAIEARTDALAWQPYEGLSDADVDLLVHTACEVAAAIDASGLYPYPNPIGLPAPAGA